jgi:hypothetical protein
MRKLLVLAAAAAGIQYVLRRRRGQQASNVWRDATSRP